MSSALTERLIAALTCCPCCSSDVRETNTPEDCIPDHCVLEKIFDCGAAVFVTNSGDYEIGRRACPDPLDGKLQQLQEEVMDAAEDEDVAS